MKSSSLLAGAFLAAGSFLLPGLRAADAASPAPALTAEFLSVDAPELAEVRQLADRAISRIGYTLVTEASSTVAKQGVERAAELCHLKDVPAMGKVIADMPRIVAFKKTSLRLRDPANAPDEADLLALNKVRRDIERGTQPPKLLLQQVEFANGKKELRAYRPVPVTQHCLPCHGPAEAMPDGLRAFLKKKYPEDEATGFAVGELRGVLRVSIGDAPPAAPAAKPAEKKR